MFPGAGSPAWTDCDLTSDTPAHPLPPHFVQGGIKKPTHAYSIRVRPASAEQYLEEMPQETASRKAARELVGHRLNGVHWRWKQRAQRRAVDRGKKEAVFEGRDERGTSYRLVPTERDETHIEFFERLFHDPTFWDAYGTSLNESTSPNARGRKWLKRRRALTSIWIEVLTRGHTTPKLLSEGDAKADFDGLSKKQYERLLTARAAVDAPPYLMDGSAAKPRRPGKARPWDPPHAMQGGPKGSEVGEMFDLQREGYYGLAAVERRGGLISERESNFIHPPYAKSFTTLREELLTRLGPLIKEEATADAAGTLYDDVAFRWWPLRALHHNISQDVALEWFLDKSDKGQREVLDASRDFRFTRATAKRVVAALRLARTAPHFSDDAIALLLVREAGTLSWLRDGKTSALARIVATESARELALSPRMNTACLLDQTGAHMTLGDKLAAERSLAEARAILRDHPDEALERLVDFASTGQSPRLHAQSYGGGTYYEIIGLR